MSVLGDGGAVTTVSKTYLFVLICVLIEHKLSLVEIHVPPTRKHKTGYIRLSTYVLPSFTSVYDTFITDT